MSDALRLADALEACSLQVGEPEQAQAAAELRRLHAENEALKAECRTLVRQNGEWQELNAELVEALKHAAECVQTNYLPDKCGHDWDDVIAKAEARK